MRRAICLVAVVLLATLSACRGGLSNNPEAGAPVIDANPLPTAITEEAFNVELTATGGEKPFEWSIESVPGELGWLTIDPATGVLGGTPTEAFDSTVAFVAKVKDAKGRVDSKPFALEVRECLKDGDSKTCYGSDGSSCFTSSSTCSGGKLAACTGGTPSIMFDYCGAGEETKCGVCSAVHADACDGVCKCGGSTACGGDLPDCCSSLCTNRASDVNHCGACETVCSNGPQNSHPVCTSGSCGWVCDSGFTKCGEACVDVKTDRDNCNSCSNACNTGYFCQNGSCQLSCGELTLCGDACVDTKTNVNNCGSCNNACANPAHGSASCSAGGCVYSCTGSYSLCSGSSCYDLSNDVNHCGNCNAAPCSGPTSGSGSAICSGGGCDIQCAANNLKCGTNCCGPVANGTAVCNGTSCDVACNTASGYTKCGNTCVKLGTTSNCGACGEVCSDDDCEIDGQINDCNMKGCTCACPPETIVCDRLGMCTTYAECAPACFIAGTPITLADGSTRSIEAIDVGDEVLSYDPERGVFASGRVTSLYVHPETPGLLMINGTLTTTPEHRFYVDGKWLHADQLRIGDRLLPAGGASDGVGQLGPEPVVMSLEELPGGVTTYNFEVADHHDYFAGGVLVHNNKHD